MINLKALQSIIGLHCEAFYSSEFIISMII